MKDLREKIIDILRSPNNKNRHPYRSIAENIRQEKADELLHLITAQNDATYAKVMEMVPDTYKRHDGEVVDKQFLRGYNQACADLRQIITKIFGKTDAKPE